LQLPPISIFDPVVVLAVPTALVLLTGLAAMVPAVRAAATDSVRAMTLGTAPPASRRSRMGGLLVRLHVPRPLSIGAGEAFARPVRGLLTLVALAIGIATATFAIGFQGAAVSELANDRASYGYGQDLVVYRYPGISDETLSAQLAQQPETLRVVAIEPLAIQIPGQKDPRPLYAMRGDAMALGYKAQRGRWFAGPGEAVVGAGIAQESHLQIGDSFTGTLIGGPALTLRLVGLFNDFNAIGGSVRVSWDTLAAAMPGAAPEQYLIKLAAGSDAQAYAKRIAALSPNFLDARATAIDDLNLYTNLVTWMVGALALILLAISATAVFNATLLTTRERVRDISVLKALGMTSRQIALMAVGSTVVLTFLATWVGVPLGVWLQAVIWDAVLGISGVIIAPSPSLGAVPLAVVAAFALALLGAALPARWAAATPVAQVLHSE
jgi:putative ABC transport system permease protein